MIQQKQNLIFDLGGVIININPALAMQAFADASVKTVDEIKSLFIHEEIFHKHERGELSDDDFFELIYKNLGIKEQETIESCWNKLLLNIPTERIELLQALKNEHNLILLSNTNQIHINAIEKYLEETYKTSLYDLFDHVFLSHQIHLRKPEKKIYEYVLTQANIQAKDSVFIDDVYENAKAAELVGISGLHLDLTKNTIIDLF